MAENALGVRSMIRLVRQAPLQQTASPQKSCVLGPQSASVTHTVAPHWCLTLNTAPQPCRGMFSPHEEGLVTLKQAADKFGQAAMWELELQVPHAP